MKIFDLKVGDVFSINNKTFKIKSFVKDKRPWAGKGFICKTMCFETNKEAWWLSIHNFEVNKVESE